MPTPEAGPDGFDVAAFQHAVAVELAALAPAPSFSDPFQDWGADGPVFTQLYTRLIRPSPVPAPPPPPPPLPPPAPVARGRAIGTAARVAMIGVAVLVLVGILLVMLRRGHVPDVAAPARGNSGAVDAAPVPENGSGYVVGWIVLAVALGLVVLQRYRARRRAAEAAAGEVRRAADTARHGHGKRRSGRGTAAQPQPTRLAAPAIAAAAVSQVQQHGTVRAQLCAALKSAGNDAQEVAKTVVPILLPLALTNKLPITPDPLVFAYISLAVARMGVAGFCADVPEPKK